MALTATPLRLFQHTFATKDIDELVYSVAQPKLIIKEIVLINPSGTDVKITLSVVPSGETLGPQHDVFLDGKAKKAASTFFTGISLVCEPGDNIYVTAEEANVYMYVSGAEFTTIV